MHWDFGVLDSISDQSNLNEPVYSYPNKGSYAINLTVINKATGCEHHTMGTVNLKVIKSDFKYLWYSVANVLLCSLILSKYFNLTLILLQ